MAMMSNAECSEHGLQRKPKCKTCVYIKTHHDTTSTVATEDASPETLRDIAKSVSLHGHPFVRLALRNAADEIERLRTEIQRTVTSLRQNAKTCREAIPLVRDSAALLAEAQTCEGIANYFEKVAKLEGVV